MWRQTMLVSLLVMGTAAYSQAQVKSSTEEIPTTSSSSVATVDGNVMWVSGDLLVVSLKPSGTIHTYIVPKGKKFMIDGKPTDLADLKTGTSLHATVTTTNQAVTARTTTTVSGTVRYVNGNFVILEFANGEEHSYQVPPTTDFIVNGKPASVSQLQKGSKVSASKVFEEPRSYVSTDAQVTGTAPK